MLKVVYDTNVVVSGLISSRGIPALLLDLVFNNRVSLYLSAEIFNEYGLVLGRPKFKLPKGQRDSVLRRLKSIAHWVEPNERMAAASDPDDNIFLECAIAGKSEFVVTGNLRHFPKAIRQISIVNPRQFLDIYLQFVIEDEK